MNNHLSMLPQVQPAIPLHNGRNPSDMAYAHPTRASHHPQLYHGYQSSYQHMPHTQHYQHQHPQQWYPYQQMPVPAPRPYQHYSSMMSTPYQIPQNPPMLPRVHPPQHAPSSSTMQSHHNILSPSSSNTSLHVPPSRPLSASTPYLAPSTPPPTPLQRMPYYPPLPWYSFSEGSFPPKSLRRRRKRPPQSSRVPVELPIRNDIPADNEVHLEKEVLPSLNPATLEDSGPIIANHETPLTSHAPSEDDSTQPTTPSSVMAQFAPRPYHYLSTKSPGRATSTLPLPIIPVIPNISFAFRVPKRASISTASEAIKAPKLSNEEHLAVAIEATSQNKGRDDIIDTDSDTVPSSPPKPAPKSWADLVRAKAPRSSKISDKAGGEEVAQLNGFLAPKTTSLSEALSSYSVDGVKEDAKISFLEPRGLVNTGNMCYMNSVLQILVFCIPFYNFLDCIGKQAIHNFKSETPLVDAMIMFVREFPIIDSAVSVEQLKMRLKDSELEQYGEAFIPEVVYDIIRRLPRFSTMRRGHQQDAEEFLGFLLEEMHEECSKAMRSSIPNVTSGASTPTNGVTSPSIEYTEHSTTSDNPWCEVVPKQKATITRSSGSGTETPITKIFGGKLRSELRVPGMKISLTLEPYQSLQLDIGGPHINNIVDALKGLTHPETLHGNFNSPKGPGYSTTKQVTIETLPQVLILHLKRFQYDNSGGTQKIWKKIGYPLELELPKEVFPQRKRGGLLAHGILPRYCLIGVVYHHGKNASGGHYTVDVRRQDGREWIRLDDTVIRRVRREDVAQGGAEDDPKVLAAALEQHKDDQAQHSNMYSQFSSDGGDQLQSEKGWSQVNGASSTSSTGSKKSSGTANGIATPTNSSGRADLNGRAFLKDNKVAYLLFYQRMSS